MELSDEDQPHESIWLNNDALEGHFEAVKERYKNPSQEGSESVTDPGDLQQNELTASLRSRR